MTNGNEKKRFVKRSWLKELNKDSKKNVMRHKNMKDQQNNSQQHKQHRAESFFVEQASHEYALGESESAFIHEVKQLAGECYRTS